MVDHESLYKARGLLDEPIVLTADEDQLGRLPFAAHVAEVLERFATAQSSGVLAVVGPWGSGKTSVLATTRPILSGEDWLIAQFNPWSYSDTDSMFIGFFNEVLHAIPNGGDKFQEVRKAVKQYGTKLSPLGRLTSLVGVDTSNIVAGLADLIGGDESVSALQGKATRALEEADGRLLVVLDDLDRLSPDELLLVLKLVRQLGRWPNVYYLLAYDEQTLLDVLMRTPLVDQNRKRARDYLEKMIQVRLDLPALRDVEIERLFSTSLEEALPLGAPETSRERQRLASIFDICLRHRLRTPRSIKRLMAHVAILPPTLWAEVDPVDLLSLTFLRAYEPGVYELLSRDRSQFTSSHSGSTLHGQGDFKEQTNLLKQRLLAADVDEVDLEGILELLAELFLPVKSSVTESNYGSDFYTELGEGRRVGHPDYVDRYFQYGVPPGDIPDLVIEQAVQDVAGSMELPDATIQMRRAFLEDTGRTCRKIVRAAEESEVSAEAMLKWIAVEYGGLAERGGWLSSRSQVVAHASRLCIHVAAADASDFITSLNTNSRVEFLIGTFGRLVQEPHPETAEVDKEWRTGCRQALLEVCVQRLDKTRQELEGIRLEQDDVIAIHQVANIDPIMARDWLSNALDEDTWTLLDVAARLCIEIGYPHGDSPPSMMGFNSTFAELFFGVDRLIEQLRERIDEERESEGLGRDARATPDNLRLALLQGLSAEMGRGTSQS